MNKRINPFGDLNDFSPAVTKEKKQKPIEKSVIDQVAADNNFFSRQPQKSENKTSVRPQRRYTTGRNQQINIKAKSSTIERFYRIADKQGVPLGEVLERALEALEKIS
jgi:hypothetical protein